MFNKTYNSRLENNTAVYRETNISVKHDASGKIKRRGDESIFINIDKNQKSFKTLNSIKPYYTIRVTEKREGTYRKNVYGFPDYGGTESRLKKVFVKVIQILVVGDIYTFEVEVLDVGRADYETMDEHKVGEEII